MMSWPAYRLLHSTTAKVNQDATLLSYTGTMPDKCRRPKLDTKANHMDIEFLSYENRFCLKKPFI